MPTNYTGNPAAAEPPSPAPAFNQLPILRVPIAGESLTISSILQSLKTLADWAAFLTVQLAPYQGVRLWNNATTYTKGQLVLDSTNSKVYSAKDVAWDNIDLIPNANPASWDQVAWTAQELQNTIAKETDTLTDITATNGATVTSASMITFGTNGLKMITFQVNNVPINSYTDVDLNAATTKFSTYFLAGHATDNRANSDLNRVGLYGALSGDKNVHRIWYVGTSHSSTTVAGVTLFGS